MSSYFKIMFCICIVIIGIKGHLGHLERSGIAPSALSHSPLLRLELRNSDPTKHILQYNIKRWSHCLSGCNLHI